MPFTMQPANTKSHRYNGIHYELVGRIGDIARRAFYPQQAAALNQEQIKRLNAVLEQIAVKMERISDVIDAATKRAAAAERRRTKLVRPFEPHRR
jgi:hypothetical protein